MGCDFDKEKLTGFLDGELSAGEKAVVEDHLRSCPECARELEELRSVAGAVGGLPAVPAPAGVAGSVGREVREGSACALDRAAVSACRDGELAAAERSEVERHVESCGECRREMEAVRSVADTLARLPRLPAPPRLAELIAREIRGTGAGVVPFRRVVQMAVAAAAMILVAIAVVFMGPRQQQHAPETVAFQPDGPPPEERKERAAARELRDERTFAADLEKALKGYEAGDLAATTESEPDEAPLAAAKPAPAPASRGAAESRPVPEPLAEAEEEMRNEAAGLGAFADAQKKSGEGRLAKESAPAKPAPGAAKADASDVREVYFTVKAGDLALARRRFDAALTGQRVQPALFGVKQEEAKNEKVEKEKELQPFEKVVVTCTDEQLANLVQDLNGDGMTCTPFGKSYRADPFDRPGAGGVVAGYSSESLDRMEKDGKAADKDARTAGSSGRRMLARRAKVAEKKAEESASREADAEKAKTQSLEQRVMARYRAVFVFEPLALPPAAARADALEVVPAEVERIEEDVDAEKNK